MKLEWQYLSSAPEVLSVRIGLSLDFFRDVLEAYFVGKKSLESIGFAAALRMDSRENMALSLYPESVLSLSPNLLTRMLGLQALTWFG